MRNTSKKEPLVTVLMAAYNSEEFIRPAIESILKQTYDNIEFLIIEDGSSDQTLNIIKSYNDRRIRLIRNYKNLGLSISLNKGLCLAKGDYIARMDSDDISHPRRIEKQVKYLEKHPDISLVGSWARIIDGTKGVRKYYTLPIRHKAIMAKMVYHIGLIHPSVLFRKMDFEKYGLNYYKDLKSPIEDKELWLRAGRILNYHNIPLFLVKYRYRSNSLSKAKNKLFEKHKIISEAIKLYYQDSLNNQELFLLSKFIGVSSYWEVIKPTIQDIYLTIELLHQNKLNGYEKAYLGFIIFQISKRDNVLLNSIPIKNRVFIYYLSTKWLICQL